MEIFREATHSTCPYPGLFPMAIGTDWSLPCIATYWNQHQATAREFQSIPMPGDCLPTHDDTDEAYAPTVIAHRHSGGWPWRRTSIPTGTPIGRGTDHLSCQEGLAREPRPGSGPMHRPAPGDPSGSRRPRLVHGPSRIHDRPGRPVKRGISVGVGDPDRQVRDSD